MSTKLSCGNLNQASAAWGEIGSEAIWHTRKAILVIRPIFQVPTPTLYLICTLTSPHGKGRHTFVSATHFCRIFSLLTFNYFTVQRSQKWFVCGYEKFVPALAYLFCRVLPGSCLARCHLDLVSISAGPICQWFIGKYYRINRLIAYRVLNNQYNLRVLYSVQKTYLEWSECNETCRGDKVGPP